MLVSPTVHGNIIVGPTAEDVFDRDGVNTTQAGLDAVRTRADIAVEGLPLKQVITSFAAFARTRTGTNS